MYNISLNAELNKISFAVGYIHTNGGSSTKAGGGGGLIGIVYTQGYVAAEMTAYGGSGGLDNAAAGVIYIKNSEFIKKVTNHLYNLNQFSVLIIWMNPFCI